MPEAPSRPFAVTEAELANVEKFCKSNGLDEIGRVCAELRVLRAEYLLLSKRAGKQRAMIETIEHDPHQRFAKEMDVIINYRGHDDASPVA
jgi:hypothetical protein